MREIIIHAHLYGIDPDNVALCGDSAGGGICVSVAKRASRDGVALRHLALFYPAFDPTCASPSQQALADGPVLTQEAMRWFWSCYLDTPATFEADLLPLHPAYLNAIPPTTIVTAEYDLLKDEADMFATALKAHGIDVAAKRFPGLIHAFLSLPASSPTTVAAFDFICARLSAALDTRPYSKKP